MDANPTTAWICIGKGMSWLACGMQRGQDVRGDLGRAAAIKRLTFCIINRR